MGQPKDIAVSVVYAQPQRQALVELAVPCGATVADAVVLSGLQRHFPEIESAQLHCAIFGKSVALDHRVQAGDRIEILRPLLVDPKQARRQAAMAERSRHKETKR